MEHKRLRQTPSPFSFHFLILLSLSVLVPIISQAQTPILPANSVVNNASYAPGTSSLAPGSIAAIFGTNLTDGTSCLHEQGCDQTLDPATQLLKTTLSGAQVTVNGTPVPIFYASPGQLGIQMPTDLSGTSATVQVTVNGQSSAAQTVAISPTAPGLFSINNQGTGQGAIQIANTPVFAAPTCSVPGAQSISVNLEFFAFITLYATGLGQVNPPVATGALPGSNPPSATVTLPQVTIGGVPALVTFAGLVPGNAGFYQVNVQVPPSAPNGDAVPVVLSIGGKQSNTVTMSVGGGSAGLVLLGNAQSLSCNLSGLSLPTGGRPTGGLPFTLTATTSGNQTVYSGGGSGSGSGQCTDGSTRNWTGSITATVTVSPAVTSLASSGGSVTGTFSYSGSITSCGSTQTANFAGSVTGTVSPGGAVTLNLIF